MTLALSIAFAINLAFKARVWWHTPLISPLQEAGGFLRVPAEPGLHSNHSTKYYDSMRKRPWWWDRHAIQTELMWVVLLREKEWKRGERRDQPLRTGLVEKRDWEWERYIERKRNKRSFCLLKGQKHWGRHDAGVTHSARYPKRQGQMCHDANNNLVSKKKKENKKTSNNNKKSSNQNENSLRFTIQFHSI